MEIIWSIQSWGLKLQFPKGTVHARELHENDAQWECLVQSVTAQLGIY